MKRKGIHRPTIEDIVEISGIDTLHPGGMALTKRTAEVAGIRSGTRVLDVSSGRGTQAVFYAESFGALVTGVDLSEEMLATAKARAEDAGVAERVQFRLGDSQQLPFSDAEFDVTINECAVGIPDDSQSVLNEMVRVTKPGGTIAIHESTWRGELSPERKEELSERYGTTPLELYEWKSMLEIAGVTDIEFEFDQWSHPQMFWQIRQDRKVKNHDNVFTLYEKIRTVLRLIPEFGVKSIWKTFENGDRFFEAVMNGEIGYCLYWGRRPVQPDTRAGTAHVLSTLL
jgi:ubiquinone/menaquinone biosynthesis C-methylase UbiE